MHSHSTPQPSDRNRPTLPPFAFALCISTRLLNISTQAFCSASVHSPLQTQSAMISGSVSSAGHPAPQTSSSSLHHDCNCMAVGWMFHLLQVSITPQGPGRQGPDPLSTHPVVQLSTSHTTPCMSEEISLWPCIISHVCLCVCTHRPACLCTHVGCCRGNKRGSGPRSYSQLRAASVGAGS